MLLSPMDRAHQLPAYRGYDPQGSFTGARGDNDCQSLPPLNEAVPEIHQTSPTYPPHSERPRNAYESPRGPSTFPEARSLAPSPLHQSRTRPILSSRHAMSMAYGSPVSGHESLRGSAGYNESPLQRLDDYGRRVSLASTTSNTSQSTTTQLGSPQTSPHFMDILCTNRIGPEPVSLPSISSLASGDRLDRYPRDFYSQSSREHVARAPLPFGSSSEYNYTNARYGESAQYLTSLSNGVPPVYENGSDAGDLRQRRRRGNLPKAVTDILRAWFSSHIAHPYPTEAEKQELIHQTGLTISQISNWFINARRRNLPTMARSTQSEADLISRGHARSGGMSDDDLLPSNDR